MTTIAKRDNDSETLYIAIAVEYLFKRNAKYKLGLNTFNAFNA